MDKTGKMAMNKNVATDFHTAVPVDGIDASALLSLATVHPKSLLDLPSGNQLLPDLYLAARGQG